MSNESPNRSDPPRGASDSPQRYTIEELRGIVPPIPGRETEDFEDFIDEATQEWAEREMKIVMGEQPDED